MLKKLVFKIFGNLFSKEFLKYFTIGVSSFVLDLGTLFVFKEYFHLSPVSAVVINQILIINFVFFLNKYWAFRSDGLKGREAGRFLLIASLNYLISIVWMTFFNHYLGFNYLLVRLANVILGVSWYFLFYKHFVYRK